jgi:hypothetical protein
MYRLYRLKPLFAVLALVAVGAGVVGLLASRSAGFALLTESLPFSTPVEGDTGTEPDGDPQPDGTEDTDESDPGRLAPGAAGHAEDPQDPAPDGAAKGAERPSGPVDFTVVHRGGPEVDEIDHVGPYHLEWSVQVPPGTSKAQLVEASERIVKELRADRPYDALTISFTDRPDEIRSAPLGSAVDAPFGKLARIGDAEPGFAVHQLDTSGLREKDWALRPGDNDAATQDLLRKIYRPVTGMEATAKEVDRALKEVARRESRTVEQVRESLSRMSDWDAS